MSNVDQRRVKVNFDQAYKDQFLKSEIEFELPGNIRIQATRRQLKIKEKYVLWRGKVVGDPYGYVTLNFAGDKVVGDIFAGGQDYRLEQGQSDFYVAQSKLVNDERLDDSISVSSKKEGAIVEKGTDNFIDVMIIYTDDVGTFSASAEQNLTAMVDSINGYLESSCANYRLRLVHIQEMTYAETGNMNTDLSRVTNGADGFLDSVHTLRDTYGADLVHLVTKEGGQYCGLAWRAQEPFWDDSYGFGVTDYDCGAITIAHEIGHNMSLAHDRYQEGLAPTEPEGTIKNGFGYVDMANKTRSIMSYATQCTDEGVNCTRIGYYSNPDIKNNDRPFGKYDFSDASDRVNQSYKFISNFRDAVTSYSPTIKPNCVGGGEEKNDTSCFIATAAYGSYLHHKVKILRSFRDRHLKNSLLGSWLVDQYYKYSPLLASHLEDSVVLRWAAKAIIAAVVFSIENLNFVLVGLALLLGTVLVFAKRYRALSVMLFISFLPNLSEANVTHPSWVGSVEERNPAVNMLGRHFFRFSLHGERTAQEVKQGDEFEANKTEDLAFLTMGAFQETYFLKARGSVTGSVEEKQGDTALNSFEESGDVEEFSLSAGMHFMLPIGVRFAQRFERDENGGTLLSQRRYTGGGVLKMGETGGFRIGGGAHWVHENGDNQANLRWLEPFVGFGFGDFTSYFFELSLQRRGQTQASENGATAAHGIMTTQEFIFEAKSETGFYGRAFLLNIVEEPSSIDITTEAITRKTQGASFGFQISEIMHLDGTYAVSTSDIAIDEQEVLISTSFTYLGL